jgi:hypothetical protein
MTTATELNLLRWAQSRPLRRHYRLYAREIPVASLCWKTPLGCLAVAQTENERWRLKRAGLLPQEMRVHVSDEEDEEVAVFTLAPDGRGAVTLARGSSYEWHPGATGGHFEALGTRVFLSRSTDGTAEEGNVVVEGESPPPSDLLLLSTLGWYVIVLTAEVEANGKSSPTPGGSASHTPHHRRAPIY